MTRTDKGIQRTIYVVVPCDGCGVPVRRRKSSIKNPAYRVFHNKECYRENGAKNDGAKGGRPTSRADYVKELERELARYKKLYGPLINPE